MKISRASLLNIILFVLLVASAIIVGKSANNSRYDPLCDVNDDGKINIVDFAIVALHYISEGTPINKTQVMIELPNRMAQAESNITGLWNYILDHTVVPFVSSKPDYDSGWLDLNQSRHRTLVHGLNTTDVFVYMIGKYSDTETPYIHQRDYGGTIGVLTSYGAYWYDLTAMTISVQRYNQDTNWNYARVMIWKIPDS
jgi:hypothetical protein